MDRQAKRVLVTGGTGVLSRALTPRLQAAGYTVRITSRRVAPADRNPVLEWAQVSLETGEGLAEATAGVDTIIHAASSPFGKTKEVDVDGTGRLLAAGEKAGVGHFFYISIVGIDRIPYNYYQHKLAAEKVLEAGNIPWSVLRATQFHELIDRFLRGIAWSPIFMLPTDFQFQLIDAGEVADCMVEAINAGPAGRLPDIGGPCVQTAGELVRAWLDARHMRRWVIRLPLRGEVADGFRRGLNTVPENRTGRITWEEWLKEHCQ